MLGELLSSLNKEHVLVYLTARSKAHAREVARFFNGALSPVQKAMDRLETAGVLVSRLNGKTREYQFNTRHPARQELTALFERALSLYPADVREKLMAPRPRSGRGK